MCSNIYRDLFQLNYADMLKRVEPLRSELQKLEDDAKDNKTKAEEVEQMIRDLEASIARYKEEYAVLISEAQAIKADLAAVEAKVSGLQTCPDKDLGSLNSPFLLYAQVNRSTALLKSLSAERDRWEKTSETFKNQMSTIAGDCLLSAAFITYAGYFEQQMRQNLFTTWSHHLQQANIQVFVKNRHPVGSKINFSLNKSSISHKSTNLLENMHLFFYQYIYDRGITH